MINQVAKMSFLFKSDREQAYKSPEYILAKMINSIPLGHAYDSSWSLLNIPNWDLSKPQTKKHNLFPNYPLISTEMAILIAVWTSKWYECIHDFI